jgi:predicted nucleic acid-binding protein
VSGERLFVDTAYVQALLNRADQFHARARSLAPRLRNAAEVWLTEAILIEVGNALSSLNRPAAVAFIEQAHRTANVHVVPVDTALLHRALTLYRERLDKTWGLTDCISFTVMTEQDLTDAVTADHHFRQAGFRALLLET